MSCFFFLFVVAQVTETRTGPLGCSNYDNLDSVSSVLVQSPENKVQLQGLSEFNYFYYDCNVTFIWGSNSVLYGIRQGIQKKKMAQKYTVLQFLLSAL